MDYTLKVIGDWTVLELDGPRLDACTTPGLKSRLREQSLRERSGLIFDLTRVSLVDSCGLGLLVSCRQWIPLDGQVVLVGVQPAVALILRLSHLDRVFPVAPTVEAVLMGSTEPTHG